MRAGLKPAQPTGPRAAAVQSRPPAGLRRGGPGLAPRCSRRPGAGAHGRSRGTRASHGRPAPRPGCPPPRPAEPCREAPRAAAIAPGQVPPPPPPTQHGGPPRRTGGPQGRRQPAGGRGSAGAGSQPHRAPPPGGECPLPEGCRQPAGAHLSAAGRWGGSPGAAPPPRSFTRARCGDQLTPPAAATPTATVAKPPAAVTDGRQRQPASPWKPRGGAAPLRRGGGGGAQREPPRAGPAGRRPGPGEAQPGTAGGGAGSGGCGQRRGRPARCGPSGGLSGGAGPRAPGSARGEPPGTPGVQRLRHSLA